MKKILTESNIKTTTLLHYLIDEYREKVKTALLNQLPNKDVKTPK